MKKPKQVAKSFPSAAPARYEATAVATCPSGLKPISGGFRVPQPVVGGSSTFLTDAEIFGKHQWVVTGVRSSTSAASNGQVTAYADRAKGKRPTQRSGPYPGSRRSPPGAVRRRTATCPKQTAVRAGCAP